MICIAFLGKFTKEVEYEKEHFIFFVLPNISVFRYFAFGLLFILVTWTGARWLIYT